MSKWILFLENKEEQGLLEELTQNLISYTTEDRDVFLIYLDWLEEHGSPLVIPLRKFIEHLTTESLENVLKVFVNLYPERFFIYHENFVVILTPLGKEYFYLAIPYSSRPWSDYLYFVINPHNTNHTDLRSGYGLEETIPEKIDLTQPLNQIVKRYQDQINFSSITRSVNTPKDIMNTSDQNRLIEKFIVKLTNMVAVI